MRKSVLFFFILITVLLAAVLGVQISQMKSSDSDKASDASASDEMKLVKEHAERLIAKGLKAEGAEELARYIESLPVRNKETANACFRLGKTYMDIYNYEEALRYFFKAEIIDPEADFKEEMNELIVNCLERLGMSTQAKYELEARSSLGPVAPEKVGVPIARVGKDIILQSDVDKELESMPEWMRERFKAPEEKAKFVQEFVSREVLYRKARRLGYGKTPEAREAIEKYRKQFAVEQLLKDEIESKIDLKKEDIELYYKANKEKYLTPESISVKYVSFEDENGKDAALAKLKDGGDDTEATDITKGAKTIPGIGEAESAVSTLFMKNKGEVSDALKIGEKFYLFEITEKQAAEQRPFSEVERQIEFELRMQKQQDLMQDLMKNVLEEQEVEIYQYSTDENGEEKSGDE